jgi:hypothetical protein
MIDPKLYLIPSVAVWILAIAVYFFACLEKTEQGKYPVWTWPAIALVGLVGLAMVGTMLYFLIYPFYYLIFL